MFGIKSMMAMKSSPIYVGIDHVYGGYGYDLLQDCDAFNGSTWISKADMPVPTRDNLAASTI